MFETAQEKRQISALTEKIEGRVLELYTDNPMITVAHILLSVETMLETDHNDCKNLRIPKLVSELLLLTVILLIT